MELTEFEIQRSFRRKMLVDQGFCHSGRLGDVVHRRRSIPRAGANSSSATATSCRRRCPAVRRRVDTWSSATISPQATNQGFGPVPGRSRAPVSAQSSDPTPGDQPTCGAGRSADMRRISRHAPEGLRSPRARRPGRSARLNCSRATAGCGRGAKCRGVQPVGERGGLGAVEPLKPKAAAPPPRDTDLWPAGGGRSPTRQRGCRIPPRSMATGRRHRRRRRRRS